MILAIDPGTTESAYVAYDGVPVNFGKVPNHWLLDHINQIRSAESLAIEMVASYGMPVGAEVFETCVWIGRFIQAWRGNNEPELVYRREVKLHLCGQARAKDGNVRQALIDRFGGKDKAIGRKASAGPLYGISGDTWQALALAVTYSDQLAAKGQAA